MLALLNDLLLPADEARVPALDRGFLYGDSVFETLAVYGGRPFRLDRHLTRFLDGCETLGIPVPGSRDELAARIDRVVAGNALDRGIVRFSLSRGRSSGRGLDSHQCHDQTFLALCFPARPIDPATRARGARLLLSSIRRIPPSCLPASVKSGNYLNGILAFREATEAGADEALMLDCDGAVAETCTGNLFFVRDGRLSTPSLEQGVLPGITREAILESALALGIEVEQGRYPLAALAEADEAFFSNSNVVIMPIAAVGEYRFQVPGPVCSALQTAMAELIAAEAGPCWAFGAVRR